MASYTLPLRTDLPHYTFGVELEGVSYRFELRWNARAGAWWITVLTSDDQPIVSRKVVVGFPLFDRYRDSRLPPGGLEAIDTTGAGLEPGLTDLGSRVLLLYTDSADRAG